MNELPVIGFVPNFDEGIMISGGPPGVQRVFIRRDYLQTMAAVGAIPLMLTPEMTTDQIIELCDGVVIAGGQDIHPKFYNEDPLPVTAPIEPQDRFRWENDLIAACNKSSMPIFGVCYGMQRLNIYYGGSLMQDIHLQLGDAAIEHQLTTHPVTFIDDFLGVEKGKELLVASRHHQAIALLGDGVRVAAVASDGIIEAARFGEHHFGMQWHPESDETGVHMYREFIEYCLRRSAKA